MNIKEEIFNCYWDKFSRLYIKERVHQEITKSFPKKHKGVTVSIGFYYKDESPEIKAHNKTGINVFVPPINLSYFQENKLIKSEFKDDSENLYIDIPVHILHLSMSFKKKDQGEYYSTGWAIGDYFVPRELPEEEIDLLLDENIYTEINQFFEQKYNDHLATQEKNRAESLRLRERRLHLRELLADDNITKDEAYELLNTIADGDVLKLIKVIYSN